jgi:hypothetical protein
LMKSTSAKLLIFTLMCILPACRGSGSTNGSSTDSDDDTSGNNDAVGQPQYEPVDWYDTDNGSSPGAVFERLEGECTGAFKWDTTPYATHIVTPQKGETQMTVSIMFDRTSIKSGRVENVSDYGVATYYFLAATANVNLGSDDEVFVDSGQVFVTTFDLDEFYRNDEVPALSMAVPLEDINGALGVSLQEGESGDLLYQFTAGVTQCAGKVRLLISKDNGDGTGSDYGGELGRWTAGACEFGETEIDMDTPLTDGASEEETIGAVIERDWTDVTLGGTWDDGGTTDLNIHVQPMQSAACKDNLSVMGRVPVMIEYGTTDGRIADTEVEGSIYITFDPYDPPEDVRKTRLSLRHDMQCGSKSDSLPYTLRGCDILESVMIELAIENESGRPEVIDEGLVAYEYYRSGDGAFGDADNVVTLSLH